MTRVDWPTQLKILIGLQSNEQANLLRHDLECLGHRTQLFRELGEALDWFQKWQPNLIVTEEGLGREHPGGGLRLAELCRLNAEQGQGSFRTQALILVPVPDWDRMKHAQRTGAHVIVRRLNLEPVIRYIQTIADNLTTDRTLGPILFGIHRFRGYMPNRLCADCEWVGATVSYGTSQTDLQIPPVRAAILNALLFRRRGQSVSTMVSVINDYCFFETILKGRMLRESAIKMEITRLRRDIAEALERIGAPYEGSHFLPPVRHGVEQYRMSGTWQLLHMPDKKRE